MILSDVLKGECLRERKKLLIFILAIVYIFWASLMYVSHYSEIETMIIQKISGYPQYLTSMSINNILSTAGNFALYGWGAGFFIFLGAFWIGDDIESKMLWNIAVASKKLLPIFLGKILAMLIYLTTIHFVIVLWLSFLSTVVYNVPFTYPDLLMGIPNFVINTLIMALFSLLGVFFALLLKNAAFGSFLGFVIFAVSQFLSSLIYGFNIFKYSINLVSFDLQYYMFQGTSDQRSFIIGELQNSMINSKTVSIICYLVYATMLVGLSYYLYHRRAKQ